MRSDVPHVSDTDDVSIPVRGPHLVVVHVCETVQTQSDGKAQQWRWDVAETFVIAHPAISTDTECRY